jgi:hypothetical protein
LSRKGRGVRVISPDDLKGVTPKAKDHFVIVGCVDLCERDMTDSRPMDQKKYASVANPLPIAGFPSSFPAGAHDANQ